MCRVFSSIGGKKLGGIPVEKKFHRNRKGSCMITVKPLGEGRKKEGIRRRRWKEKEKER